ncbi:MAG: hypothetical protein ACP5IB_01275 [Thermoplasmata archaeon]
MPFLTGEEASIASSLIVIFYGIYSERGINSTSVFFNMLNFLIVLSTIIIQFSIFMILLAYTLFGFVVSKLKTKSFYFIFSSKIYGSLMFVLSIFFVYPKYFNNVLYVLFAWFIISLIVYIVYIVVKR